MPDLLQHLAPTRLVPEGHYGPPGIAGVHARTVEGFSAATLVSRRGASAALTEAAAAAGLPLQDAPRVNRGAGLEAVGIGPGRWLALTEGTDGPALVARLEAMADGHAAVTDQSDANLLFEVSGERVRDALAKGVGIDLHPSCFSPGDAATTTIAHVGVTFWQVDGQTEAAPAYRFAVPRSFAPAFLRWLAASAAEYGFTLSGTGRG